MQFVSWDVIFRGDGPRLVSRSCLGMSIFFLFFLLFHFIYFQNDGICWIRCTDPAIWFPERAHLYGYLWMEEEQYAAFRNHSQIPLPVHSAWPHPDQVSYVPNFDRPMPYKLSCALALPVSPEVKAPESTPPPGNPIVIDEPIASIPEVSVSLAVADDAGITVIDRAPLTGPSSGAKASGATICPTPLSVSDALMFLEFGMPYLLLSRDEKMEINHSVASAAVGASTSSNDDSALPSPGHSTSSINMDHSKQAPASPSPSTRTPSVSLTDQPLFFPETPAGSPPKIPALPEPSYTMLPGDTEILVFSALGPIVTALQGRLFVPAYFI